MKTKGIYFLYRILQAFGLPVLLLYFLFRGLRNRLYWHSLPQRFGSLPRSFRQTSPGAIWLHVVSVGEVLSCVELLRRLRSEFPHSGVFVSTSTLAGRATADDKLGALADGVFYAPVDYVFAVRRVLRVLQPSVVAIAETEIWPNLFRETKRTGAALTLVNGRISDRAFPRYLPFRWFFRDVLSGADSILAQTGAIRERFVALGAPAERVRVTGNFKYDFEARRAASGSPVMEFLERARPDGIWIAASTMPPAGAGDVDEDDAVIAAFQHLRPRRDGLLLILAPRKPERFDAAAQKLQAAGLPYVRRSAFDPMARPSVLLLDTIGELGGLFPVADAVFMGGTLAKRGGHNILEPAFFARPVVIGPHMENFQAIADEFRAAEACVEIRDASGLAGAVERLLDSPEAAREIGARALACAEARRGATARALEEIRELHGRHVPRYHPALPWLAPRWVLARVWEWGSRRKQARALSRRRKLDVPVISIGNITLGGTGKTPCVLMLAAIFKDCGLAPGILTRGYRRSSPHSQLVVAPGASVEAEQSGDEPALFIRSGLAPVGIGKDRFQAGALLLQQFPVKRLLLDDGFQHWKLARDVDIVLIDALDPLGGGDVFPLGRLREPLAGLSRADIILITRGEVSDLAPAVERAVRGWNSHAPVFRASIQPRAWVDHRSGTQHPIAAQPFESAGMFCGLGNPHAFLRTLHAIGMEPVDWIEFGDHHRYRPYELQRISKQLRARGAGALVTTGKDAMNLGESASDLLAPLPLYWLQVSMTVDRESEFIAEIERRLGQALASPPPFLA